MILALGTRKQVGKDTTADYLIRKYGFIRIAFADQLKQEVQEMLDLVNLPPYSEENKEVYRPFLIAYGELRRKFEPKYWIQKGLEKVKGGFHHGTSKKDYVITDMRYPNEAGYLLGLGAVLIRINRETGLKSEPTEAVGDEIKVDYEIDNNKGYDHLYKQIDKILNERRVPR